MKKILFILPDLNSGGSQKFVLNLINDLLKTNNYKILLFVSSFKGGFNKNIPKNVDVLNQFDLSTKFSVFSLIYYLIKYKPEVTFSVLNRTNIINIVCSKISLIGNRIIIRESNSPSKQLKNNTIDKLTIFLCKILYRFSSFIISQTDEMRDDIINFYKVSQSKVITLHNPLNQRNIDILKNEKVDIFNKEDFIIVSVGRVESQKGYDLTLKSLVHVKKSFKNFKLYVIGETNTKNYEAVKNDVIKLDLAENVIFLGFQSNPYKFIYNSNLFLLTSYFEGLPNVILEARYLKIPIVVTNTLKFYKKIISKNDGYLTTFDSREIAKRIIESKKLTPTSLKENYSKKYLIFLENA